ncbi:N-acetylmuramoyl-L-alanine amidase [Levilactobacillus parabrevis]|uniref:N-acetylmuramoyl-L-alanine amidase n=1 Tax=Levilactobacillus parabrevis TaxID=357278 RepID=UPI0021A82E7F|nr:N-acetylmuramoyl-L-alanine amidase [Levilactobacillus parabrevis]MCT4488340.1 N-acetylmuramoyl-L-alanine amidase [Levilactobacillus parabrevis]MCT4491407.1 N-acetylmuramoyl-L-alanine amidase [Levilactobacillus parabrevis]
MNFWGSFKLFFAIAVVTIILGLNGSPLAPQPNQILAHADTTINVQNQGMIGDDKTANNSALQSILTREADKNLTINVPKGVYLFDAGCIKLHSNITFNFDKGATFRTTLGNQVNFVYPSPKAGYNGGISNIKWQGATFQGDNTPSGQSCFAQSIHHGKKIEFNKCTFINAESPGGHYIDLEGSHNIDIKNSTFIGFNGNMDFKEAIQIDYSNPVAMSYKNPGDQYDNLPTYNVKVNNNRFLPIYNSAGQISSYAPNPIGEHAIYNNGKAGIIHDIHFTNNTVVDPKPLTTYGNGNIRFIDVSNLWITNNKFINKKVPRSGNYIYLNNVEQKLKMTNLNIKNNSFTNIDPNTQYIFLTSSNPRNPMHHVNITGNKITSQKNVSFIKSNFSLKSPTIKISKNNAVK